jgi:serine/threonine protein kinase
LQIFAVKESILDDCHDSKYRDRLNSELEICKALRHPHIVSYLGHDYTDQHLYIYLEYVAGGSVASILSEFGPLFGPPLRKATLGMLEGLDYLHTRSPPVVHRDIKGANVLVDLEFCVKLADFGCSKCSNDTKSFTTLGSVPWMAPEVISQEGGHGRKADIWSFGCTVIEMASAEKPWGNGAFNNVMFALHHIATSSEIPPVPENLPGSCDDLIRSCVRRSQDERPNTRDLLEHEFFGPVVCKTPSLNLRRFKTL